MRRNVLVVALFGAVSLADTLPGQDPQADGGASGAVAGAFAPVGRWYTMGGSASRSGASAQRPLFGDKLSAAWEFTADGPIEEEPLVWDDIVVLATRVGDKERHIHVLGVADGKPLLSPRKVATDQPLGLSLWGRLVAFRENATTLRVEMIGASQFTVRTKIVTKGNVSAPLLFGSEIYYTQGTRLERWELGAQQPTWSSDDKYVGRASLVGDHVFATRLANPTEPSLVVVDRQTGKMVTRELTAVKWSRTAPGQDFFVGVGKTCVVVTQGVDANGTFGAADRGIDTVCYTRDGTKLQAFDALALHSAPAIHRRDLLLLVQGEKHVAWVGYEPALKGRWRVHVIANDEQHPTFVAHKVAPLVLHDVVCIGDYAFDADTLAFKWRASLAPTQRTVPARETLLVTSGSTVRGMRAHDFGTAKGSSVAAEGSAKKGLAVLRDGRVLRGDVRVDAAGGTLGVATGKRGETFALGGVLWAEEGDSLVHWADQTDVDGALARLVDETLVGGYAELARKAVRTNDPTSIARMLSQARLLGADDAQVTPAVRALDALRRNPGRVNAGAVNELQAEEAKVRARAAEVPWRRVVGLPESAPGWLRTLLVESTLGLDPDHAGAVGYVRKRLPDGTPLPEKFDAASWLAVADARQYVPMTVVAPGTPGYELELTALEEAKKTWRPDLLLVCSDRLFVIAAPSAVAAVARCIATGEVVVDALHKMFEGMGTSSASTERLRIQVYESQAEYLDKAAGELLAAATAERERRKAAGEATEDDEEWEKIRAKMSAEDEKRAMGLQWTLGVFSPTEKITRLYVPAGKEGFAGVIETFSHEVTHHWLDVRGPRVETPERSLPRLSRRGYWIVEGFASFIQGFLWDVEARKWETLNPRNERIDMFAHVPEKDRVAWNTQLTVSQVGFHTRLSKQSEVPVVRTHYLGGYATSEASIFYSQAATTCSFLFHGEDGKFRKALLEYVVNWYSGVDDKLSPEAGFGVSAAQLGTKVGSFAKEILAK